MVIGLKPCRTHLQNVGFRALLKFHVFSTNLRLHEISTDFIQIGIQQNWRFHTCSYILVYMHGALAAVTPGQWRDQQCPLSLFTHNGASPGLFQLFRSRPKIPCADVSARLRTLSWPRRPGVGSSRGHLAGSGRKLREALPQTDRCAGSTPLRSEPLKVMQGRPNTTFTTVVITTVVQWCHSA